MPKKAEKSGRTKEAGADQHAELRARPQVQAIISELEKREKMLRIGRDVASELRSYMDVASSIPKRVNVHRRESVNGAQEALHLLQGRLDRVLEIQYEIFKVTQALGKLEILGRSDLAEAGVITSRTSAAAAKQLLSTVLPELSVIQQKWKSFEKLCSMVQDHLGNAKDTLRLQIRLDENANWNRRYSG